jgi:histidinol-phosphate aminotransferase
MLRVPQFVERLEPYEPGWMADKTVVDGIGLGRPNLYLASNENAAGCSPAALQAIRCQQVLHRYPHSGRSIRHKLAEVLSLSARNIVVGNGSDSIIGTAIRTFGQRGDQVLTSESTFPSFGIQARALGISVRTVPYKSWCFDLDALAAALTPATKIVYLPNPNNPTGTMFTDEEFRTFHKRVSDSTLVILDQAYFEYAVEDAGYPRSPYLDCENVLTLRTFSKAYGLAGLRLGYGLAPQRLIDQLRKIQLPFDSNCLAEAAAVAALDDQDFISTTVSANRRNRALAMNKLRQLEYTVVPSTANFVMVVLSSAAEGSFLTSELGKRGIVVRWLRSFGLPQCIRITIGSSEEMDACLREMAALRPLLAQECLVRDERCERK